MHKVLVCSKSFGKYTEDGINILKENNCEIIKNPYDRYFKEEDFLKHIKGIDSIIVSMDEVTSKVIDYADSLKIISVHGTGVDNIDVGYAEKKSIYVANVPSSDKGGIAVADLAFGLLIAMARKIIKADAIVKKGVWERLVGSDVGGATIGVVGTGRIGTEVIKRAKGFGLNILAFDMVRKKELEIEYGIKYVSLNELLRKSDFITVHVPLNKDTVSLIGEKELSLMKKSAYIINVSRGDVVNEKALYYALKNMKIAGAAIDVYSPEPPDKNNPLFKLENVITTPHYGVHTLNALGEIDYICACNVVKVLNGEKPMYPVNNPDNK